MLKRLIVISRPRFWMYLIGPYLIGIGSAQPFNDAVSLNPNIFWWLLFFTLPANLFVYGMNDISDMDTDIHNNKKGTYEARVDEGDKRSVVIGSVVMLLMFLPLYLQSSFYELLYLVIFIIFGVIYSIPPIRLKAIPFVDSLSNGILYTMAGLMGYTASGGGEISFLPYLVGAMWAATMHAYSAIPDIIADTKAGIKTIATVLREKKTLFLCFISYLSMGIILYSIGYAKHTLLSIPYMILIALSYYYLEKKSSVFSIYKVYPYVTYVVGALVYALI